MAEAVLRARADLDSKGFDRGLNKMKAGVKTFSTSGLSGIAGQVAGAFSVAVVANFTRQQLQAADAMRTLSETIGMSTDSLQALYSSGRHNNVGTEKIDTGLAKLANAQEEVINGNKAITDAFGRLGISAEKVASMDLQDLFAEVAAGAQKSATGINDITEIMGRGMGVKMMPLLKEVAEEGFGGITAKAKEAGEVIDAINIQSMADMADQLEHGFKRATDFLMAGLMKAAAIVEDIAGFFGAMAGGASFSEAITMVGTGQVGSGQSRKAAEEKVASDKANKELERTQKLEQQKANIKAKSEKEYQEKLAKILEKAAQDQLAATEKYDDEKERRRLAGNKAFQQRVDMTDDLDYEVNKILNERTQEFTGAKPEASDQYARLGMFSGGQINNAPRMMAERQLKATEESNRKLERIADLQEAHRRAIEKLAGE